ncbi:MAG: fasciclin domain-containing protein [Cyclobacteriaceae bacterium]
MKKRFLLKENIKTLVLAVVAVGVMALAGCNKDDDEEPEPTETTGEIIEGDDNLSEFYGFISEDETLNGYITGSANYTVFAPQNAAFDRLRTVLGIDDLGLIASEEIGQVLSFHFASGTKLKADLLGGSASSAEGSTITVTSDGFINEAGSDADGSEILEADRKATNGVVHVVETILIPPVLFADIGTSLATLAQPITLGADFTDLETIIDKADEADGVSFRSLLKDKEATLTTFFPTNEVFAGVAEAASLTKAQLLASINASPSSAKAFLESNMTDDEIIKGSDLEHGYQISMVSGLQVTALNVGVSASVPTGWVLATDTQNPETYKPIYATDVFLGKIPDPNDNTQTIELESALNGAIHVSVPFL